MKFLLYEERQTYMLHVKSTKYFIIFIPKKKKILEKQIKSKTNKIRESNNVKKINFELRNGDIVDYIKRDGVYKV